MRILCFLLLLNWPFRLFCQNTYAIDTLLPIGANLSLQVNGTYSHENAQSLLSNYFPYNGPTFTDFCSTYFPDRELLKKFSITNPHNQEVRAVTFSFNQHTPYRTGSLLSELTTGLTTSKSKSMALYQYVANSHLYYYAPDNINIISENYNASKFLNTYGFGHCGMIATGLSQLADRYSGLNQRFWSVDGGNHGLSEIQIDSNYVCLDADQEGFYLLPDNTSLATFRDVQLDKYLYMRTKHFGKATPFNWDWNRHFNQFISNGFHFVNHTDTLLNISEACCPRTNTRLGDDVTFDLKPNSTLTFFPDDTATVSHFAQNSPYPSLSTVLRIIGNGMQETDYKPFGSGISTAILSHQNVHIPPGDTVYAALQDGVPARIILREKSPLVIHNGSIEIHFYKQAIDDTINIYFSKDSLNWVPLLLNASVAPGNHVYPLNLLSLIQPNQTAALYQVYYKIDFVTHGGNNDILLRKLTTGIEFQFNKLNGPKLQTGQNQLQLYALDSLPLITKLQWEEDSLNHPPNGNINPIFPANNMVVDSNYFTFSWSAPSDPDADSIIDYQIMVGEDQDITYPLAGIFDRALLLTNGGLPYFTPEIKDYFSPNRTYYWKVRAQDAQGLWGAWSPVWSFSVKGPAYPKNLRWEFAGNKATHVLKLCWDQNTQGNNTAYYKIFSSNDRNGFFPADSTELATTLSMNYHVHESLAKTKHRVVAYDAQGNASSASYMVNKPRFLIGKVGTPFDYLQTVLPQLMLQMEPWPTVNAEDRDIFCLADPAKFQQNGTSLTPIDTGYSHVDICTRIGQDTVRVFQFFIRIFPSGISGTYHTSPSLLITPADTTVERQNGLLLSTLKYDGFINGDDASTLSTPAGIQHSIHAYSPVGLHTTMAQGATSPNYQIVHQQGIARVLVNPAGTESTRKSNKRLHLIPNPAEDFVRLVNEIADNNLRYQVLIYNMQGQRVMTVAPYQHGQQIPIGNLTKGTYTIRLLQEQGAEVGYAHFIKK